MGLNKIGWHKGKKKMQQLKKKWGHFFTDIAYYGSGGINAKTSNVVL